MADSALEFLLENLKQHLMSSDQDLISDANDELNKLLIDLELLKPYIYFVPREQDNDKGSKEYEIQKIRNTIYEVEDTIDSCITNPKSFNLAKEVKSLRENKIKPAIDRFRSQINNFEGTSSDSTDPKEPMRIKALRQDNVVGLEEQMDTLIQKLNEETDEVDVLSIVGMPALGKTTLAWNIYRDPRIQLEFPVLIWVYVSQDFNMKYMLLTILKKFTQEDMYSNSINELTQLVREYLEKAKFLIFMDDVWTVDAWQQIQAFLPKSNTMGRVLMTTRDVSVASYANNSRPPHQLKFLSNEKSVELLYIEVNGILDETFPGDKEIYGKIIGEKCGGLPLAVEVIGALLVDKFSTTGGTKSIWKTVSKDVMGYLFHEDQRKNLENIISMSYNKLPYDLRDCFLYLGMFPENTEISVWNLIQLWIVEGFVRNKYRKSLEDIAQDYLKELIDKNLVMVAKTKFNGEVKTCILHNTVRKFCQKIACYERQNLFEEIRKCKDGYSRPFVIQKCRRLSIHSYVHDFFSEKLKVPKARSFLFNSSETINLENIDIPSLTDAFELLRVFDVNAIKFPIFPANLITKLIHLRYITLSCEIAILPEAISKLWNLQTLIVDTLSRTLEIKADIPKMMQLRHVKTKASIILNKDLKGQGGENLQTLTRLSSQSCTEDFFNKVKNIKTLGIRGGLARLLDSNCLEKLYHLEKLKLINDVFPKVASENLLHSFSLRFPINIKILTISDTFLDWSHMSKTVGNIPNLEVLKLKDNAFVGNSWKALGNGFHKLEFLYIARMDLMSWTASDDSFPKLRSLAIENCENLQAIPFELRMNLELLSLKRVTKFAVNSARTIKQEKMKETGKAKKGGFKLIIASGDE